MRKNPQHKIFVFALFIALIFSIAGCGSQTYKFLWLNAALKTDDLPNWGTIPVYRLEDMGGSMALVNDSSRFYVRFFAHGQRLLRRLGNRGLTLELSNPANKTQRFSVHFPLGMDRTRRRPEMMLAHPRSFGPDSMRMPPLFRNDKFELAFGDSVLSEPESLELAGQIHLFPTLEETKEGNAEYILGVDFNSKLLWIQPGSKMLIEVDAPAEDRSEFHERRPRGDEGGDGQPSWGGHGQGGNRGGGVRHRREQGGDEKRETDGIPNNQKIHFTFAGQLATQSETVK